MNPSDSPLRTRSGNSTQASRLDRLVRSLGGYSSLMAAAMSLTGLTSVLCPDCFGQDNTAASTLRVKSQLVILDPVVTTKDGRVVTNLNRDDFSIFEDGVEQEIRYFSVPGPSDRIPETPRKDKFGKDDWGDSPLTLLVLDALNTPFDEIAYSRQQANKYLSAQPELLNQPTTILWLDDAGIHPIAPLTRVRQELLRALQSERPTLPGKLARGAGVERLSSSLAALQQIALFSRGSKGGKQIVWIGRSFPGVDGTQLGKEQTSLLNRAVSSTLDLLLTARAAIYVVDPALNLEPPADRISTSGNPQTISPFSSADPFLHSFSFTSFVDQSGGKYFYGGNDLNNEIASSIDRGTHFYTIGYVPSSPIEDGRYRKIEIRLKNSNLQVQSKQGYYPTEISQAAPNERDLRFDLHEAAVSRMPYNSIGVAIRSCGFQADTKTVTCEVIVYNHSLTATDAENGEEHASIVSVFGALDQSAVLLGNSVSAVSFKLPSNPGANSYSLLRVHLTVPSRTASLRVVVRDIDGRIGTADLNSAMFAQINAAHIF